MKSIAPLSNGGRRNIESTRRFPITDYNYQAASHVDFRESCATIRRPSFHDISRDYFGDEAWHDFLAESVAFGAILAMSTVAISYGAMAAMALLRSIA
jgi:hypothetical protein